MSNGPTAEHIRYIVASAMGLKPDAVAMAGEMFADIFDLCHGGVFDEICTGVERRFNLPPLTPDDFERVFTLDEFISMIEAKIAEPIP